MEDHSKAALIWNYKTREELREALENEIRSFTVDKVSRQSNKHTDHMIEQKTLGQFTKYKLLISCKCLWNK